MSVEDDLKPSLWRDLADGTAGWGVRIILAIALAVLLTGLGLVSSYGLAAVVPSFDRARYYGYSYVGVRPRDELLLAVFLIVGTAWVVSVIWLFARRTAKRAFMAPSLITVGLVAVTVALGILADSSLRGDSELVIVGLCLISAAVILIIWVQAIRNASRLRPVQNPLDKLADLRCPECGYRMVGLHESRCPECGRQYTLDELVLKQGFAPAAGRGGSGATGKSPVGV